MSVYLPTPTSRTYVYDFEWRGQRYKETTSCTTPDAARQVEAAKRKALRDQAAGLVPPSPLETPTFTDWAELTLAYQAQFITRPAILERTLRMILGFWGAAPAVPIGAAAVPRLERAPRPYHHLRLGDPIADPGWLLRFEEWMTARGISGSTRNSYLSACSDLYTCAMQPQYQATTGITRNPFEKIRRSPPRPRTVALEPATILALIEAAPPHIARALCIAALAPKLRMASILALEWATHVNGDATTITVADHKTRGTTGLAQTVPVSGQLRAILLAIREAQAHDAARLDYAVPETVVSWKRGRRVASIKKGLRRAVEAIGLSWGLRDGVTFHVIRHSVATILADPGLVGALTERLRADMLGHREIRTTQKYTHLKAATQAGPHESLSAALPDLHAAMAKKTAPRKPLVGKIGGPPLQTRQKPQQNRIVPFVVPQPKTLANQ